MLGSINGFTFIRHFKNKFLKFSLFDSEKLLKNCLIMQAFNLNLFHREVQKFREYTIHVVYCKVATRPKRWEKLMEFKKK